MDGGPQISLAEIAALVGAITGPLGLLIALFSYWRDRPRLWISVAANMRVVNSEKYDSERQYLAVTVSNIGRRPEYVTLVSLLFPYGDNGLLSDTFLNPAESNEGKAPLKYLVDQTENSQLEQFWPGGFVLVRTSSGRQYRSQFLREKPKGGVDYSFFQCLKLQIKSRLRHRWAFRRRYLE